MSDAPGHPLAESRGMQQPAEARTEPSPVPAIREDLRDHLPGVEAERRLTDWGRSERIDGLFDRTVVDFFYRYWFRHAHGRRGDRGATLADADRP